ncbi:protein artichoke-like [Actinia tenebrosa]|uniref:Protein artichoke-like n=1 Tax=Actinia tenebrosa TaxID=6105 RepID=A0A6P8IPK9_ACTTE|nr:protein artichoke-like [Actinia tenebrosa]
MTFSDTRIFMKATIEIVKNGTFASRLPNLRLIDLSGNCLSSLASIESGWYGNKAVSHTLILILNDNKIRNITKYSTKGKGMLNSLGLKRNLISFIEEGAFEELHWLEHVDLSNNLIANLEPNTFVGIGKEIFNIMIDVSSNRLTCIKRGVFAQDLYINSLILFNNSIEAIEEGSINSIHLDTLDIRNNMLKDISILPWGSLDDIFYLYLGNNSIQNLTVKMFEGKKNLRILDIGYNELGIIRKDLFTGLKTMLFL